MTLREEAEKALNSKVSSTAAVLVPGAMFNSFIVEQVQVIPERSNQGHPEGASIIGVFDTSEEAAHFVKIHQGPAVLMWWRPVPKLKFSGRKDRWPKRRKR